MRANVVVAGRLAAAVSALMLQMGTAQAQEAPANSQPPSGQGAAPQGAGDALGLEEIVVTATVNPLSKFQSSVSVSTLTPDQIQQSAPTSSADILRDVPGIRSEASGGEGNANISVRGLPVASGGAKYVQFQEDGMPVLDFGDIAFATADTFVKADYNLARLEVIRGGSASTFASNAPGGVFNFISKTGDRAGGNIGLDRGVNFDETRMDFDYGEPINDKWKFHVGGFYRIGEGPRTVDYTAESGGQLKANLTREFSNGFLRFNVKLLDDRAPAFLPVPMAVTGSGANPHYASLPGFDVLRGAMQSPYFERDLSVDAAGTRVVTDIADGYLSKSTVLGGEASFNLAGAWKFNDKIRVASTSGGFVGPYPASVDTALNLATSIGGAGSTLQYATGPQAGSAIADPSGLNGNGLASKVGLFNVTLNNMGNAANDLKLTKSFDNGNYGTTSVSFGYFKSYQNIDQDWHWNTYLEEVKGKDAALLDVVNSSGALVTQNGLVNYGDPFGGCCTRSYQLHYNTDAPYLSANWQRGPFNFDGSLRYDISNASGTYAGATGTAVIDVNQDGVIQPPEKTVPVVNNSAYSPVNYTQRYLSYSFGGNYKLNRDLALFARISDGGRANADRLAFGSIQKDGSVAKQLAVNMVRQIEGGVKWKSEYVNLFATAFNATTEESNQDVTSVTQRFINRKYDATGLELETVFQLGGFSVNGSATYTHARIVKDDITPADVGNRPQRQATFVYQITPAYNAEHYSAGLNLIGTTDSYADPTQGLVQPGYVTVNAFAMYEVTRNWWVSFNGSNLFNTIGITEVDESSGGVNGNGLNTARSILGRTVKGSLKYSF